MEKSTVIASPKFAIRENMANSGKKMEIAMCF